MCAFLQFHFLSLSLPFLFLYLFLSVLLQLSYIANALHSMFDCILHRLIPFGLVDFVSI